jgi:hypothetical protein
MIYLLCTKLESLPKTHNKSPSKTQKPQKSSSAGRGEKMITHLNVKKIYFIDQMQRKIILLVRGDSFLEISVN